MGPALQCLLYFRCQAMHVRQGLVAVSGVGGNVVRVCVPALALAGEEPALCLAKECHNGAISEGGLVVPEGHVHLNVAEQKSRGAEDGGGEEEAMPCGLPRSSQALWRIGL